MSRDGYGIGALGSHQGFGYLGDDDDDAGGGAGSLPAAFEAIVSASPDPVSNTWGVQFSGTVTVTSSGAAQTNGSITVTVTRTAGTADFILVASVATSGLAGWTETGWSNDGNIGPWTNTYTKASITLNEADTITFYGNMYGAPPATAHPGVNTSFPLVFSTKTPAPATTQATGGGNTTQITTNV